MTGKSDKTSLEKYVGGKTLTLVFQKLLNVLILSPQFHISESKVVIRDLIWIQVQKWQYNSSTICNHRMVFKGMDREFVVRPKIIMQLLRITFFVTLFLMFFHVQLSISLVVKIINLLVNKHIT